MEVRELRLSDLLQVNAMDELSGNDVSQWVAEETEDYAYGLFDGKKLVGYCTIGGADDVPNCISSHPAYNYNSLLLSDVYVMPECRKKGLGTLIVSSAIRLKAKAERDAKSLFIALLYDGLSNFYSRFGFEWVDGKQEYAMVKILEER